MSEWRKLPLKEITVKIGSGSTPTGGSGAYKETGVSLIRSQNVLDFSFTNNGLAFIDEEQAHALRNVIVEPQDVLLNITGDSVARCCSAPREWLPARVNQHVAIIRANPKHLDSLFLKYSLISIKDELLSLSEIGGTRNALTKSMLENLKLFVPSVIEQKAIASVLSSIDNKIDLLHRQNKTLESMANTLFRQWFIEESQDEWPEATLNQYVELNKSSIDKKYNIKEIQYLDTGSLTKGKISKLQKILLSDAPSRAKRLVNNFDIIISTVRPDQCHYGICIAPPSNLVVSTGFCVITSKSLSPFFIYYLITSEDMTEYLHSIAEGSTSTYPSLKPEDIGNIPFLYPSEEKLKNFHDLVGSYWNKIHNNHKKIQTLETLRDTLLPKLMSGDVRVQYAEEAIASVA
ncbi:MULTISPECIES: restriction endonuclease subunit S [unclassified Citrobacter]|uniref:restriction endonuclease subunit S n=1 Tax=Citrobacter TaxID=544 RepID=UPI0015E91A8D|nr:MULTISPECIES: restriction endonuclease subunit S [unclassified Citrobacter]MBA8057235.1 restriction endonuclease subunit S [Citrobacter sp. RHBSTW-00104]QLZ25094.1 restriction endonuclease subunit S [Citrobacter sp. RHBSTW-00137]QMA17244.1 restriction endonuclease subunit S [Citrobacter sp. RHBSTW-00053]QMA26822.1 restriction endonuclease subunit S [Citrobacter sp. RHBSTW-00021]